MIFKELSVAKNSLRPESAFLKLINHDISNAENLLLKMLRKDKY